MEFWTWLRANVTEPVAVVVQERGRTVKKIADLAAGRTGSVPREFAKLVGAKHVLEDLPPATYAQMTGGARFDALPAEKRTEIVAAVDGAIADAAVAEARRAGKPGAVLVVCGNDHREGIARRLREAGLMATDEDLRVHGWHLSAYDPQAPDN
jgi:hypothetical protein